MAKELRQIGFTRDEVQEAVVDYCQDMGIHMPFGPVKDVVYSLGQTPAIKLVIETKIKNEDPNLTLDQKELTMALVRYCKTKHVMLPRLSPKVLHEKNGIINMTMTYGS